MAAPQQLHTTRFLLVCGAPTINDQWLFGDFIGFHYALKTLGQVGESLNVFPVTDYFDKNPTRNDIKFGTQSATSGNAIQIYTRHTHDHREPPWKQFKVTASATDQGSLLGAVYASIERNSQALKSSDIFNLLLIGHGSPVGIYLGGHALQPRLLAQALDHFVPGVRVNVIVKSCKSGTFVDTLRFHGQNNRYVHSSATATTNSYATTRSVSGRVRNSIFVGAFLQSLVISTNISTGPNWSLQAHLAYLAREGKSKGGGGAWTNPQQWTDIDLLTTFSNVLFTEYTDQSFTQTHNAARRVITPPNPAQLVNQPTVAASLENLRAVAGVIELELLATHNNPEEPGDTRIAQAFHDSEYFRKSDNRKFTAAKLKTYTEMILPIMQALRWRMRIQEPFFLAFDDLLSKDLFRMDDLVNGVPFSQKSRDLDSLVTLLQAFEVMRDCCGLDRSDLLGFFSAPVEWFVHLILRSATDGNLVLSHCLNTAIFGKLSKEWLQYVEDDTKRDYTIGSGPIKEKEPSTLPAFAFWLPRSFESMETYNEFRKEFLGRYNRAANAYEKCFGKGSWGEFSDAYEIIKNSSDQ
ncbi:MAG: hypothetical protein L6R41_004470 [Letrouitia leprolyta]|nr:MAG: hypothetical protein L6R41_004470 [Letrouitia leprolyta]